MPITQSNHPAFPTGNATEIGPAVDGLTKREYFAALALQGLLTTTMSTNRAPGLAVSMADQLIEELNKIKGKMGEPEDAG